MFFKLSPSSRQEKTRKGYKLINVHEFKHRVCSVKYFCQFNAFIRCRMHNAIVYQKRFYVGYNVIQNKRMISFCKALAQWHMQCTIVFNSSKIFTRFYFLLCVSVCDVCVYVTIATNNNNNK